MQNGASRDLPRRWSRRLGLRVLASALATGTLMLAGCAGLGGGPRTVELSEARLMELINRPFPESRRYLDLFDVTLSAPRLRLLPAQNRIGTELSYSLGASVLSDRQMTGLLGLSYGLRYEASDATLRLADVQVEKFDLHGLPKAYAARAPQLGRLIAQGLLSDLVVYRLDAADLRRLQGQGLQPGSVTVVPGGLQLRLDPLP